MLRVEKVKISTDWDQQILNHGGHPLQLWGWGEVKSTVTWEAYRIKVTRSGESLGYAQILVRRLPWPLKGIGYIPRGPVVDITHLDEVLAELVKFSKRELGIISLLIEPDIVEPGDFRLTSWHKTTNSILTARTIMLDLKLSDDELLSKMSKKTRQYIRKSAKTGVVVRKAKTAADVEACLNIYQQTAKRADFSLHRDDYYKAVFDKLGESSQVYMAEYQSVPVAFLWLAVSRSTAFELYGGMTETGQKLRANYILKWYSIKKVKEWGIDRYDLNGLLNDGVSTFKKGFSDHETQLVGSYEKSFSPLSVVWSNALPMLKKVSQKAHR